MIATRFNPLGRSGKPYAYEVEYLEATGTQWIDTGVTYSTESKYEIILDLHYNTEQLPTLVNAPSTATGWNAGGFVGIISTSIGISWTTSGNPSILAPIDTNILKTLTIEKGTSSNTILDIEGYGSETRTHPSLVNRAMHYGFPLFGLRSSDSLTPIKSMRMGKAIIKVDDIVVRDVISVVGYDGIACMYDKVTKRFFYNQGTGEFIKGERI